MQEEGAPGGQRGRQEVPDQATASAGPSERRMGALLSARARTPAQAERLERLRCSALELASDGGYAAVTMRAVAKRAGVGLATVYRYFSSKDHLIADVHAVRSLGVIAGLARQPPAGKGPAERLAAVFERMLETTAADLNLASAGVAALSSGDPAVNPPEYWRREVMDSYLQAALGDAEVGDREILGEVLGHVFFSLMIGLATGQKSLDECKRVMGRAVHLVLSSA